MPPSGLPALTGAGVSPAPFVVPSVPVATAAAAQPGRIEDRLIAAAPQAMPFTNWRLLIFQASRKQDGEDAATESWQGRDPWGDAVNVSLPAGIGKPGLIVPVTIVTAKKHSLIGELRG